jgi:hypothetical protein
MPIAIIRKKVRQIIYIHHRSTACKHHTNTVIQRR